MQVYNRFFDDFARVASGAMGVAAGFRDEFEGLVRQQIERVFARMDLVTREEFEAVKAMAAKARSEQEALAERVAALEKRAPARRTRSRRRPEPAGGPSAFSE